MRPSQKHNAKLIIHRSLIAPCAIMALAVFISPALSLYIRPDLEKIPIHELIETLKKKLEKDPENITLRHNLARAHAMSFASKGQPIRMQRDKHEGGIWFGYEANNVPFGKVVPSDDPEVRRKAKKQLEAAIESYEVVLKQSNDHVTARLGYAWCLEQADEIDEAVAEYRKVVETAWNHEKRMQSPPVGFRSVVAEAARYLIPLLNADRDAAEIAVLTNRAAKTGNIPRPITPIAVPLRDGLSASQLIDEAAAVRFDADGTARPNSTWTWITPNAAWLVYDHDDKGKITSSLQLFGNVTFWMFWKNGYEPLALLDRDGDGELRADELRHLALWHDSNRNGVSEVGEVRSLSTWGIVALSTCATARQDSNDCVAWSRMGVVFADGQTRPTYDLILHERPAASESQPGASSRR